MIDDDPDSQQTKPENAGSADSAVDPKAIKQRTLKQKQKQHEARDWWRAALSTEIGRRELWGVLAEGHPFEKRFGCGPNGSPQPEGTLYESAKQDYALNIFLSWLKLDRDGVNLMLDENDPRFAVNKKR
jgi:hypothetical protein